MKLTVVYHSGAGSTKVTAEHIATGALQEGAGVNCISILEALDHIELLHDADTIVFGCPTNAGTVSAPFKHFMELTQQFREQQIWKNKLSAGFTTYDAGNSEKLITLVSLSLFAEQHGMIWISGISFPIYNNQVSFLAQHISPGFVAKDLLQHKLIMPVGMEKAELFGRRIASVTNRFLTKKKLQE